MAAYLSFSGAFHRFRRAPAKPFAALWMSGKADYLLGKADYLLGKPANLMGIAAYQVPFFSFTKNRLKAPRDSRDFKRP